MGADLAVEDAGVDLVVEREARMIEGRQPRELFLQFPDPGQDPLTAPVVEAVIVLVSPAHVPNEGWAAN